MIRYRNELIKFLKFLVELERYVVVIMFLRFDINVWVCVYRLVIFVILESVGEVIDIFEKVFDIEK